MAVYLPEKVFAVCTNQLSAKNENFKLSIGRELKSVRLGSKNRTFLVKIDKSLSRCSMVAISMI